MFKQPIRRSMLKHPFFGLLSIGLIIFALVACGSAGTGGNIPTDTPTPVVTATTAPSATPSPTSVPFKVSSIDLSVSPQTIAGKVCGSPSSFTYIATFHIPAATAGGRIAFSYTLNNGRSQTEASVSVGSGETTKTYTFTSSGTLFLDHTYPGIAEVLTTSPNMVNSPQVKPTDSCTPAAFQVTSIDMAVSPTTIAGLACGSPITVTYTATFHIAPNSAGGTIQFVYTVNNGRGSPSANVSVSPGETTKNYSFTWMGNLPADHTYPGLGGVITSSPNAVNSSLVMPTGMCH